MSIYLRPLSVVVEDQIPSVGPGTESLTLAAEISRATVAMQHKVTSR